MNANAIASIFSSQTITPASWLTVIFTILLAFGVGLFILWTYKTNYRGVMYSSTFGLSLVLLTLITAPVVMCIRESIQLSMGMVGALSIVRFRTAVKDPLDTTYMFWALTMGILLGAKLYIPAVVVALGISLIMFALTFIRFHKDDAYLLVVHYDEEAEGDIQQLLRATVKNHRLRSKTVTRASAEMTVEVRLSDKQSLVANMLNIEGVYDATLVACQTDAGT